MRNSLAIKSLLKPIHNPPILQIPENNIATNIPSAHKGLTPIKSDSRNPILLLHRKNNTIFLNINYQNFITVLQPHCHNICQRGFFEPVDFGLFLAHDHFLDGVLECVDYLLGHWVYEQGVGAVCDQQFVYVCYWVDHLGYFEGVLQGF